jgi:hypothetical protein
MKQEDTELVRHICREEIAAVIKSLREELKPKPEPEIIKQEYPLPKKEVKENAKKL